MAERKATNKYYPPDWDPSKGSLNSYVGQHPLRDRARKLSEGILIIRFEMPFNIWCLGCERHIARGVRFNAEKKQIGKYFTTPIFSFRMKCPSCSEWIEIHTDPKESEYQVISGAKRKSENWKAEDLGLPRERNEEEKERAAKNPFFQVEHEVMDARRSKAILPALEMMKKANETVWKDDWEASRLARKKFRAEKREREVEDLKRESLRRKGGFDLKLIEREHPDDIQLAKSVKFKSEAFRLIDEKEILKESNVFDKKGKTGKILSKTSGKYPNEVIVGLEEKAIEGQSSSSVLKAFDFKESTTKKPTSHLQKLLGVSKPKTDNKPVKLVVPKKK